MFNGKELDEETGLYYYGARYYDPQTSMFLSVDPLAEQYPVMSPFSYAANNPVRYVDVFGKGPGNGDPCQPPKIIRRSEWGARPPITGPGRSYEKINETLSDHYSTVVIHHSGNDKSYPTMNQVQDKHMDGSAEKADIGYHFGIDKDGNIYEGRPIGVKGAHVDKSNSNKIGIVLLGDFDSDDSGLNILELLLETGDDQLTGQMKASLKNLIIYLNAEYGIDNIEGHKEVNPTRHCPGKEGMEVVDEMKKYLNQTPPPATSQSTCGDEL